MARVPFLLKPRFRAHVIVFASRRDGKWLGWGIYSEYPLAQKHDGTQTEQKLLFVVDAESYERAEKTAEFIVGNDVRLPGNNPRFFALSQILRKTVLQEASHDTPSGKSFAQAAMGILCGFVLYAGCFNPNLAAAKFKCDTSHFCPEGLSCVEGVCSDKAAGESDGGSNDAAAVADLVQVVTGCRDGKGADVSGSGAVFACPGAFEASPDPTKNAARLCAPSYKPCVSAAAVGGFLCAALDGFFLADVSARAALPNTSCGAARAGESPGLAGCGKAVTGVYAVPSCAGFRSALFAVGPSGIAVSAPYSLESATNITNTNGVLCCK